MRLIRLAKLFLLLILTCGPACALELGAPAPDFTLPGLDGQSFKLSDLRGQIVLLKLATTWCPACAQQSQELMRAEGVLQKHGVTVVEVFLQDSADMVKGYLQQHRSAGESRVLLDDDRVRRAYNVYLIPRTLVIDREFRVRRDGNLLTEQELSKLLAKIDSERSS